MQCTRSSLRFCLVKTMDRAEIQKKIALLKKDLDSKEKCLRQHSQKKAKRRSHVQEKLKEHLANASLGTSPCEPRKSIVTFKVDQKSTKDKTACCAVTPADSSDFASQDPSGRNAKKSHRKRLMLSPIEVIAPSGNACDSAAPVIGLQKKRRRRRRTESVDWSFLDEDSADMYSVVKRRRSTLILSVSTQEDTPELVEPSPEVSVKKRKTVDTEDAEKVEQFEVISSGGTGDSEESVSLLLHSAKLKLSLVDSPVVEFSLPDEEYADLMIAKSNSEDKSFNVLDSSREKNLCHEEKEDAKQIIHSEEISLFRSSHEEISLHGDSSEEEDYFSHSNDPKLLDEESRFSKEDEIVGETNQFDDVDEEITASPEILMTSDEEEELISGASESPIVPDTKCEFFTFSRTCQFSDGVSATKSPVTSYMIPTLKDAQHFACLGDVMVVANTRRIFVYLEGRPKCTARISRIIPPDGDEFIIEAIHLKSIKGLCTLFISASNCTDYNVRFFSTDLKPVFSTYQIPRTFGDTLPCILALSSYVFLAVVDVFCCNTLLHQFTVNETSENSTAIEGEIKGLSSIEGTVDVFLVTANDSVCIWSTTCNRALQGITFPLLVSEVCLSVLDIKGYLFLPVFDAEGGKVIALNPVNGRSSVACSLEIPSTWKARNLRWKRSLLLSGRYVCAVTHAGDLGIWSVFTGKLHGVCADVGFSVKTKDSSLMFTSQLSVKMFNFSV